MLDSNFFSFFCANFARNMSKGFSCRATILREKSTLFKYMRLSGWYSSMKLTSWISSTALYASVGNPRSFGFASIITRIELGVYFRISSLMAMSFCCNFGPVWYQPTIFSRAVEQKRWAKCEKKSIDQRKFSHRWLSWTCHTYFRDSRDPKTKPICLYHLHQRVLKNTHNECHQNSL